MRNLFILLAATLLVAACSPSDVEMVEPINAEQPTIPTPGKVDTTTSSDTTNTGGTTQGEANEANDFNNNKYWLLYKVGKYELYNREEKTVGQFSIDQAERLLRMPSTVWEIPKGAPYVFNDVAGLGFDKRLIK